MSNGDFEDQDNSHSLSLIVTKLKIKWKLFTQSILCFPVIFVTAAVLLFILTSRLDELFFQNIEFDIPYLTSLIFAGSADAARSILSTIAAGWATILGVAFSVTLITLQLSITKYTSHLVNRFEGDKTNQLALGWFIGVVTYALLVLKTIRTSDSGGVEGFFTPLIGVNVTIIMAIISLFIFVLFLRNIASYLRPNMLIANVVNRILSSLRPYEKRMPEKQTLFIKEKHYGRKIFEIRSRNEGVLSYLNWHTISIGLMDLSDHINSRDGKYNSRDNVNDNNFSERREPLLNYSKGLWMKLSKSVGDSIRKNEILAEIYDCSDQQNSSNSTDTSLDSKTRTPTIRNGTQEYDYHNSLLKREDVKRYRNKILSGMEITPDRSFDKDPLFGIELLRTLAVKSAAIHDTDVVSSTISGLFSVLIYTLTNEEKFGIPFSIQFSESEKQRNKLSSKKSTSIPHPRIPIIINPKEQSLRISTMNELSIIINTAVDGNHLHVITQFINEYISMSFVNLELEPPKSFEQFAEITDWFATLILYAYPKFPDYLKKQITDPIIGFYNDLRPRYPKASETFLIYMRSIIDGAHH